MKTVLKEANEGRQTTGRQQCMWEDNIKRWANNSPSGSTTKTRDPLQPAFIVEMALIDCLRLLVIVSLFNQ